MTVDRGNFTFLKVHDAQLVRLGALAERYFKDDPNTCLMKLRQFAELLAQQVAARHDDEQQEISRMLEIAWVWLDKIATEHARAEHLLPKLDQAVLAKAFKGEL